MTRAAERPAHRGSGPLLLSPVILVLLGVFVAPVLLMAPMSLREYEAGRGIGTAWTLDNYVRVVADDFYREVIWRTLGLGFGVTLACLLIGYPIAYFLARTRSRWRTALLMLVIFPLMLNLVVRSFGWIALLANRGLVNNLLIDIGLIEAPIKLMFNLTGLMIGLTHIYLPFMVLMLMASIQAIPRDLELAAETLGSSRAGAFFAVTLPLSGPGILGGSILVFVLSISALVTPRLLGGPTYKVMSTLIYDEFMQLLDWPSGSALAFVLTLIALAVIRISSLVMRRWAVVS